MAMPIQTRYAALAELELDAAAAARWLSPRELTVWQEHASAVRRATWLAGRMVSKTLILQSLHRDSTHPAGTLPSEIDIDSRSAAGKQGDRPVIRVQGRPLPWALSIAHNQRGVLVALATTDRLTLGVDLVARDAHAGSGLDWCLSPDEFRWRAAQPTGRAATAQLWVVKEAIYKACQRGEGFAPRQIEMLPGGEPHYPQVEGAQALQRLQCWRVDGQLAALAVAAA